MLKNDYLDAWDRESFFHPSTPLGAFARGAVPSRTITGGEGVYITDSSGRRYLDAFAGLYCVNVGYGRQEIAEAIAKQARELAYYHAYAGHGTEASVTLAKMVMDRAPKHMSKIYFGLGGSDANETNVKLVWNYFNILGQPQKRKIIARWRGYHGSGIMSGSLTGLDVWHKKFNLPLDSVRHTDAPYFYKRADRTIDEEAFSDWLAGRLEEMILAEGPDTVAAFIGEPVLGTGGIIPPPKGYWEKIQPILKKYDILFIVDEVVTGFGRIGTMFACEHYGLEPDFMTIAKGLTSAYAPLSGSIVSKRVFDVLAKGADDVPIGHGWTYSAHPIGAAAGVANLKLVDRLDLPRNAADVGAYLLEALVAELGGSPIVGEVRGVGMLHAIELAKDPATATPFDASVKIAPRVAAKALEKGLVVRAMPQSDIIGISPPLSLTRAEADQIVGLVAEAIADVAAEVA